MLVLSFAHDDEYNVIRTKQTQLSHSYTSVTLLFFFNIMVTIGFVWNYTIMALLFLQRNMFRQASRFKRNISSWDVSSGIKFVSVSEMFASVKACFLRCFCTMMAILVVMNYMSVIGKQI